MLANEPIPTKSGVLAGLDSQILAFVFRFSISSRSRPYLYCNWWLLPARMCWNHMARFMVIVLQVSILPSVLWILPSSSLSSTSLRLWWCSFHGMDLNSKSPSSTSACTSSSSGVGWVVLGVGEDGWDAWTGPYFRGLIPTTTTSFVVTMQPYRAFASTQYVKICRIGAATLV